MVINRRKLILWTLGFILVPFLLILLLGVALYIPAVQRWAVALVEERASEALGMSVSIGELRLVYPIDLSLRQVTALRAERDTLAHIDRLDVSVTPMPLLDKTAVIPRLRIDGLLYNDIDTINRTTLKTKLNKAELLYAHIAWEQERLQALSLEVDGLSVYYHSVDTAAQEKSEPLHWVIEVSRIGLTNSHLDVSLPNDSLYLSAVLPSLNISALDAQLLTSLYTLRSLNLSNGSLHYKSMLQPLSQHDVFSPQNIKFDGVNIDVRQLKSQGVNLELLLTNASMREQSGLNIRTLKGAYQMDSLRANLSSLTLETDYSNITGMVDIPWSILKGDTTALLSADFEASLGIADARILLGDRLDVARAYKRSKSSLSRELHTPIKLDLELDGTLLDMSVPSAQFVWENFVDLGIKGQVYYILDDVRRRGKLDLTAHTGTGVQSLLKVFAPHLAQQYNIPSGLAIEGDVDLAKGQIATHLEVKQQHSRISLDAHYTERSNLYEAIVKIQGVDARTYMPAGQIGYLDARFDISGSGYDPFNRNTNVRLEGKLSKLVYQSMLLNDITFDGALKRGEVNFNLNSFNPGLNLSLLLDGTISSSRVQSSITLDSQDINLSALGFSNLLSSSKFKLQGELDSDMRDSHHFTADVRDMQFVIDGDTLAPKEVNLMANTGATQSLVSVTSGDLKLRAEVGEAPTKIMARVDELTSLYKTIFAEIKNPQSMRTRLEDVVVKLPSLDLDMELGTNNALRAYLLKSRLSLEHLEGQVRLRPNIGIDGYILATDLRRDTLRINCLDVKLSTERIARASSLSKGQLSVLDSMRFVGEVRVDKTRFRHQPAFTLATSVNASLQDMLLQLTHYDEVGNTQNRVKMFADWGQTAYQLHFPEEYLVLAGVPLNINSGNWLNLNKKDYFLSGNLTFSNSKNTSLHFEADHDEQKSQTATLSIQNLLLEDYSALGLPSMSGKLMGDINYQRNGGIREQPTINGDISIQNLSYDQKPLGHFALALFYEPRNDNSHYLTAEVSYKGNQAMSVNGIYTPNAEHPLKGQLELINFPLEMVNPFSSSYSTYLEGGLSGQLALGGSLTSPLLLGNITANKGAIELREYATTLRLDSLPLAFEGDRLVFKQYALRSGVDAKRPIYLDGSIHTHGASMLKTNLHIFTNETMLINQARPRSEQQTTYGRLVASADIRLSGSLAMPRVRGNLGILSGTNCTYVMRESILDTSDKSTGLVCFKDFSDTIFLEQPVRELELGGMDMNVALKIDPNVRFNVNLTADGTDYMNMQGGGNMQFRYLPYGEMNLRGRYDMSGGGTLQYTLPVVGSKQFAIDPSGYIAFEGDIRNPYINFIASQKVRAATGESDGGKTNFNVSIKAKNKVEDINLTFDLSAPENLNLQNTLVAMSSEERAKQAIGLLATGTYLGGSSANNLNLNETFSALLQSQINTVAGSLLKGTDLSVGMDLNDGVMGTNQTSYTYSFSRRFYNDRIRVVVGGKIHTGNNMSNREQSLIDNVSLEYQMDKQGERFIQIYHKRVTDNVIEGEYNETGAGVLLKRKLDKLSELFSFGKKQKSKQDSSQQSIKTLFTLPKQQE